MKSNIIVKSSILLLGISFLASCAREDHLRTEGITLSAGDAIARNRMLQVIDPWPEGVEDTDLLTPNSRSNDKATDIKPPVVTTP